MAHKPVYLYSGLKDDVVARQVMVAVQSQLANLTLNTSVLTKFDIASEHGIIVDNTICPSPARRSTDPFCGGKPGPAPGSGGALDGGCCGTCDAGAPFADPWWRPPINNCGYDMAGEMLQQLLGTLALRTVSK